MAKAKRIKALKRKEYEFKKNEFLKIINGDEPIMTVATIPGFGSFDVTDNFKKRSA